MKKQKVPPTLKLRRAGFALLTLIFIIIVFGALIIGIVSLATSSSRLFVEGYRYEKVLKIAEAGRAYAEKYLLSYSDWTQNMGFPFAKSFGEGVFTVSTANELANSLLLYSTGVATYEGQTYARTIKISLEKEKLKAISDYVIYWYDDGSSSASTATINQNVSIDGNILAEGNIDISNNVSIEGDVYTSGSMSGNLSGITGTYETGSALPSDPPTLTTTYYDNLITLAAGVAAGNLEYKNETKTLSGQILVNGDVIFNKNVTININGSAEIIATGDVNISNTGVTIGNNLTVIAGGTITIDNGASIGGNNLWYSSTGFSIKNNSNFGLNAANMGTSLITPGDITMWNNACNFYGLIFCGGTFYMKNNNNFYGNIIAANLDGVGNNSTLICDPNLVDHDLLPGLGGGWGISASGWDEVL